MERQSVGIQTEEGESQENAILESAAIQSDKQSAVERQALKVANADERHDVLLAFTSGEQKEVKSLGPSTSTPTTCPFEKISIIESRLLGYEKPSSKSGEVVGRSKRKGSRNSGFSPLCEVAVAVDVNDVNLMTSHHFADQSFAGGKPSSFVPRRFAPKLGLAIKSGVMKDKERRPTGKDVAA